MSRLLCRALPSVQAWVKMPDGFEMYLDSAAPAECSLLFHGTYSASLAHFVRQRVKLGAHCLDIGANLGYYSLLMAHYAGAQGRVAAFEANPALLDRLQAQAVHNGFKHLEIVGKAVSDHCGQAAFYISKDAGKSSLGAEYVRDQVRQVDVDVTSVDHFIQQAAWPRLDVVKIDIEGYDLLALLGAKISLAAFKPLVVFEFWRSTPKEWTAAARTLLCDLGYRAYSLHARSGALTPFEWQLEAPQKQADVVLMPADAQP